MCTDVPYIYGTAKDPLVIDVWDNNNTITIIIGSISFRVDINTAQELRNKITKAITSME